MRLLALLCLFPSLAFANVSRDVVTSSKIDPRTPARYVAVSNYQTVPSVANGNVWHTMYAHDSPARLVDVIVYQIAAGVGGTSLTVDIKNAAGTSLLTTLPVLTLASGADKGTDARGAMELPSGWTRPVLKTDSTVQVTKGTRLVASTVETGSYSTKVSLLIVLIFEPLQ